jgi:hypothetical protein
VTQEEGVPTSVRKSTSVCNKVNNVHMVASRLRTHLFKQALNLGDRLKYCLNFSVCTSKRMSSVSMTKPDTPVNAVQRNNCRSFLFHENLTTRAVKVCPATKSDTGCNVTKVTFLILSGRRNFFC